MNTDITPNIENPTVTAFTCRTVRPLANRFFQMYFEAKAAQQMYSATGVQEVIESADQASVVVDSAPCDKSTRAPMTAADEAAFMKILDAFTATMEEPERLGVLAKIQTKALRG